MFRTSATTKNDQKQTAGGSGYGILFSGCDSFKVAGQFQSGRQAFLAKNYEEALTSFQQVARADPNYIFESGLYRQGNGTMSARSVQYRQVIGSAQVSGTTLSVYQDDHLAKLYLGLTRARSDDSANGARDIESGMKGLYGSKFPLLRPPPRGAGEERGEGSETFVVKVGFPFCFIFGCGFAALGSLWLPGRR